LKIDNLEFDGVSTSGFEFLWEILVHCSWVGIESTVVYWQWVAGGVVSCRITETKTGTFSNFCVYVTWVAGMFRRAWVWYVMS
jgi:hypothetical protein